MVKRLFSALLCVFLLLIPVAGIEIRSPGGSQTLKELQTFWEENGYPDNIAYLERHTEGGLNTAGSDYSRTSDVEYWTVGVLGDAKPVEDLLRASISNDCEIAFQTAQYSRNEIRALYPEVVRRYCRNIGCSAVVISGDQIVVRFSPLLMGLYQKSAARDYGGRVRFQSSLSYHFEGYDENGNYIHDSLPDMTFELFAGIALVLLILILLTFGVLSLIRLFLRRRKRAGKPSQKLLDKLQGGESP